MSNIDRRDFLKGLTLSSATLFVPGVFVLGREDSPPKTNHLIGLGSASYQVFLTLQGQPDLHRMTVLDIQLPDEECPNITLYPLNDKDFQKQSLSALFDKLFSDNDNYFIVAGLGRTTGNMVFRQLANWMKSQQKEHRLVAMLPFHFEGQRAMDWSKEALSALPDKDRLSIVELENFRRQHGNLPLQAAMELAHHEVLRLWEIG